jgi:hypothetical protein
LTFYCRFIDIISRSSATCENHGDMTILCCKMEIIGITAYAISMQTDARSANPYVKRIQYLGEINRLKRITVFLRTVASLCDVDNTERRYERTSLANDHGVDQEEKAFIEDCRLRLQALTAARSFPEIVDDLVCRYVIAYAERAANRRVPLVGECNKIRDIANLYHDGTIKEIITALTASYSNSASPGKASEGATLLISLNQRNAIKISGGTPELRKKVKSALNSLPKPPNSKADTRRTFLEMTVHKKLEQTTVPEWYLAYIQPEPQDYAVYDDGNHQPLESILPSASENHGGFYEYTFLWLTIQELPKEQQNAIGKFLRPRDYDGNLINTLYQADTEDIYRVLTYLKRRPSRQNQ